MKLGEELLEPGSLSHAVSNSAVLRLGIGVGHNRPTLGRPGHQFAVYEDGVAGGRAPSVRAPDPVSVSVDDQLGGGRPVKKQPVVDGAVEVAEEALESS